MPRTAVADGDAVYRVVVERHWVSQADGVTRTTSRFYGPYNSLGAARGVLTREVKDEERDTARARRYAERAHRPAPPEPTITGRVERAAITWEEVPSS